jgi:uncharacterized Zn finger protein
MAAAIINTYQTAAIFRVTVKATGKVFYAMPTGAGDGSCYHVEKRANGKLTCTCPDHQYRSRDCKHILALVAHLRAKAQAAIIRQAEQIAANAPAPSVPERTAMTPAARRETALLYTDDKPFSIFKS